MRTPIMVLLFVALGLGTVALAADADAKDKPAASAAGEQTKTGTVGVKPSTAAADVVAMFYTPDGDYKLLATGEAVAKIEELAKRKAKAKLTGTVAGDKFTVSQVVDLEPKADNKGARDKNTDDKADRKRRKKDQ